MTFVCRLDYYRDGSESVFTCFLKRLIFRNLKFVFYCAFKEIRKLRQYNFIDSLLVGWGEFQLFRASWKFRSNWVGSHFYHFVSTGQQATPFSPERTTRVMRNEIKRLDTVVTHTMCWCELRRGQRPAGLICGPFCCLRGIFSSIDDENSRRRLAGTWEKPKSHSRNMQIAFLIQRTAHNQRNGQRFLRILTWHVF